MLLTFSQKPDASVIPGATSRTATFLSAANGAQNPSQEVSMTLLSSETERVVTVYARVCVCQSHMCTLLCPHWEMEEQVTISNNFQRAGRSAVHTIWQHFHNYKLECVLGPSIGVSTSMCSHNIFSFPVRSSFVCHKPSDNALQCSVTF